MSWVSIVCLLGLFVLSCGIHVAATATPVLLFEWSNVTYNYTGRSSTALPYPETVEHNCITGVKIWRGRTFVSVPRWKTGVPSTLNEVFGTVSQPILKAYPSWELQDLNISNTAIALRYVQSMEIDTQGIMWILDAGRLNFFDVPSTHQPGAPRLVLWDIDAVKMVSSYTFQNDVASYTGSFLNDLVLDQPNGFAYISDASSGAIVVYSRSANNARRFADASTQANPNVTITVNGIAYPGINNPTDGIALSADRKTLFYCALQGDTMYSLPTSTLQDFSLSNDDISKFVQNRGPKPPSDGMAFSNNGHLYYGDLNGNAVYGWDVSLPISSAYIVAQNNVTMQWADTFAFDGNGNLIFSTNQLQLYFFGGWTGPGAHMRLFSVNIGGNSYLEGQGTYSPPVCSAQPSEHKSCSAALGVGIPLAMIGGAAIMFAALALRSGFRNTQSSPEAHSALYDSDSNYYRAQD